MVTQVDLNWKIHLRRLSLGFIFVSIEPTYTDASATTTFIWTAILTRGIPGCCGAATVSVSLSLCSWAVQCSLGDGAQAGLGNEVTFEASAGGRHRAVRPRMQCACGLPRRSQPRCIRGALRKPLPLLCVPHSEAGKRALSHREHTTTTTTTTVLLSRHRWVWRPHSLLLP